MPRQSRERSNSGVYHTIIRGVNKQRLFEEESDYHYFISKLYDLTFPIDENGNNIPPVCTIYAYCLMSNHVHLLIKEQNEPIGEVMKRLASAYVFYYNHKYERIGHLYQERFRSEPCNDIDYFATLLRYIHRNPVKAGIANNVADYPYSSWKEYIDDDPLPFCSTKAVLKKIPLDQLIQIVNIEQADDSQCIDIDDERVRHLLTDDESWAILSSTSQCSNVSEFQKLDRELQKKYIRIARNMGAGPRAISRITGIPYSIVQRAK